MIQHNDSDTSCMRALALLERTLASEAELPPKTTTWHQLLLLCALFNLPLLDRRASSSHAAIA